MSSISEDNPRNQAIVAAFDLLGKKWTGTIIYTLLSGPMYFNELERSISALSSRMLTVRLKELESYGIVSRTVLDDTPIRVEYALTDTGYGLKPVFSALVRWAEQLDITSA